MDLQPHVLAAVVAVSIVQSLFGVGVLLFGTPLLLLAGHAFVDVLLVLLPVSIGISLSQAVAERDCIDRPLVGRTLKYAVPMVIVFLAAALTLRARLGLVVAALLLLYAIKGIWPPLASALNRLARWDRLWLVATGAVHGLTNLGGSMLTLLVHEKGWPKAMSRATIAACYLVFATFQLALLLLKQPGAAGVVASNAVYVASGLATYAAAGRVIDRRVNEVAYVRAFSALLLASALLIAYRSI
ncbi:MAG TPA: TSUP family transporter [Burkholderiaceae bacterium]|nr:TSUP family transporter [Burkholderiaceae bacterium]